jgi:bifunctional UDP-N-acetylglucosamine pyrophosphorylase/glucosamine-1-phosphate N-acetyltransferase
MMKTLAKTAKIEQVVVLAAGNSSRMWPFCTTTHKAELELLGQPLIDTTLDELVAGGIANIVVVVNKKMGKLRELVQSYQKKHLEMQIRIVVQEKARGQGDAILAARKYLREEFFVINASQVESVFLMKEMQAFAADVVLAVSETETPWLYGMAKIKNGRVKKITEKPSVIDPEEKRILGIYRLNKKFVRFLAQWPVMEYSYEEALSAFCRDRVVKACQVASEAVGGTLKYPWHLLTLQEKLLQKRAMTVGEGVTISPQAVLKGRVIIDDGAVIGDLAVVEGPVYVGRGAIVGRMCTVRAGSVLEEGVEVQSYGEVRGSLLMRGATMHSGFIGDSVIGAGCQIGAGVITANRRLDRAEIAAYVKKVGSEGEWVKVKTGRERLGVMMGDNCRVGIGVRTMPGVMIAAGEVVEAGEMVRRNMTRRNCGENSNES